MKTDALHINQLDLFSGIGGFHLGFERAGYKVNSYFSEVDKHAIAVYKQQFKDSTYVGSVTDVRGADLPNIDLITFGSPCQDFSLAGKRKGMDGERSSLILEAIRLISECRPRVFVWENVKGTFSSNDGRDFAAILQEFANIGGYRLEWQLLNTSWFLPQNRERIYLVGYSTKPGGDWRGVFPIGEGASQGSKLERQQGIANCLHTKYQKLGNGAYIGERTYKKDLGANQAVVQPKIYDGYNDKIKEDGIVGTITQHCSRNGMTNGFKVVQPNYTYQALNKTIEKHPEAFKKGEVKAIDCYNQNVRDEAPCLTSPEHNTTRIYDGRVQPTTCRGGLQKNAAHFKEKSPALTSAMGMGGGHTPIVDQPNYRIRRLTPIECERLQGFPDNHTEYGNYDGEVKKMSNTQRYKQCGNAVTVDVVKAVAEQLKPIYYA